MVHFSSSQHRNGRECLVFFGGILNDPGQFRSGFSAAISMTVNSDYRISGKKFFQHFRCCQSGETAMVPEAGSEDIFFRERKFAFKFLFWIVHFNLVYECRFRCAGDLLLRLGEYFSRSLSIESFPIRVEAV